MHERAVRCIAKYLASTSTYVYLPDVNQQLATRRVVFRPDILKLIKCYVNSDFAGGWAQEDADNSSNVILRTVYVITYVVCPVLWCSKLQTYISLSTTEV